MNAAASGKKGRQEMFLRRHWRSAYAIVLIVIVPIAVALNTVFVINRFRAVVDAETNRTAAIVGAMFNTTSTDLLDEPAALQNRIEAVAAAVPEVQDIDILKKNDGGFTIEASTAKDTIGRVAADQHDIAAWQDDQTVSYLTTSSRAIAADQAMTSAETRRSEREQAVIVPLKDASGATALLLSMKLSLAAADALMNSDIFWAFVWLSLTLLFVVVVLVINTRLFQYASLNKMRRETDQMKDDFISMASHELRAPISAIRGYLSLFLDSSFGKLEDKPRQALATTFAIATHLGTLVEDLLETSRLEQGRVKMDLKPTAVEPVIEELMQQLRFEAENKKLTFEFRKPAEPLPSIVVDESRLRQVLTNLVTNAIKYTPAGSVIVSAEKMDDGLVEIRVKDTGIGMSADAREKLFRKFYRIRTEETAMIPGTGLGLWIVKQLVELMHGKIFCDSIEHVGTQMSVLFPATTEKTRTAAKTPAPSA
jgi:signal transduction histidine kinase